MLEGLTRKALSHITKIDEGKLALAKHGLDILINDGRNIMCVFLLSFLLKNVGQAIVYLLVLSTLRVHTGGWHAPSETKCFLSYQGMFIMFSFLDSLMIPNFIDTFFMITSVLYVVYNAPIEHKYNPLSYSELAKNRCYSLVYCFLFLFLFILTQFCLPFYYSQAISIAFVYNATLMELLKRSENYRYYEH